MSAAISLIVAALVTTAACALSDEVPGTVCEVTVSSVLSGICSAAGLAGRVGVDEAAGDAAALEFPACTDTACGCEAQPAVKPSAEQATRAEAAMFSFDLITLRRTRPAPAFPRRGPDIDSRAMTIPKITLDPMTDEEFGVVDALIRDYAAQHVDAGTGPLRTRSSSPGPRP
jgi:hypothetical protein